MGARRATSRHVSPSVRVHLIHRTRARRRPLSISLCSAVSCASCNVLVGASIVGTCHSRHLASIYAYLCRPIHKNPKLSRLDLDGSATRESIVFLVSTSIAASVEELTIGSYEPLRKQDIADLEVPQLLQAAGMSLRALCITLRGLTKSPRTQHAHQRNPPV